MTFAKHAKAQAEEARISRLCRSKKRHAAAMNIPIAVVQA
jgi:hypothetical protein